MVEGASGQPQAASLTADQQLHIDRDGTAVRVAGIAVVRASVLTPHAVKLQSPVPIKQLCAEWNGDTNDAQCSTGSAISPSLRPSL